MVLINYKILHFNQLDVNLIKDFQYNQYLIIIYIYIYIYRNYKDVII